MYTELEEFCKCGEELYEGGQLCLSCSQVSTKIHEEKNVEGKDSSEDVEGSYATDYWSDPDHERNSFDLEQHRHDVDYYALREAYWEDHEYESDGYRSCDCR